LYYIFLFLEKEEIEEVYTDDDELVYF